MANRPRPRPRDISSQKLKHFLDLIPEDRQERRPDCAERIKQAADYEVNLDQLRKTLWRAQASHRNDNLQKARLSGEAADTYSWLEELVKVGEKLQKLADRLWKDTGRATHMRAALELAGWKSEHQIDFLNYAHAIAKTAERAKAQLTRPAQRPKNVAKQRGLEDLRAIQVPKFLRDDLLRDVGL